MGAFVREQLDLGIFMVDLRKVGKHGRIWLVEECEYRY